MSKVRPSPGPWVCLATSQHYYHYTLTGPFGQLEFNDLRNYANARLIGKAPDMYNLLHDAEAAIDEMLQDFCSQPEEDILGQRILQQIRDLLTEIEDALPNVPDGEK